MTSYFTEMQGKCKLSEEPWTVAKEAVDRVYGYLEFLRGYVLESEAGRIGEFLPTLDSIKAYVEAKRGTPDHLVGWDLHQFCHSIQRARLLVPGGGWASEDPQHYGTFSA